MMKKLLKTSLISLAVLLTLAGCGGGSTSPNTDANKTDNNTTNTKHSPIARITATPATANIYTPIALDGSQSSDADGDQLSFAWSLTHYPSGSTAHLQNTTNTHSTLTADKAGVYTVKLTVNDGRRTATSNTNITIRPTNLFRLTTASEDNEPWFTNGTSAGTHLITDLNRFTKSGRIGQIIRMGNKIFFAADDGIRGRELWVKTSEGVHRVKDIAPGTASSNPGHFVLFDGMLYFAARGESGFETLWMSDGTEAGTQEVRTVNPPHDPHSFVATGNRLFFSAYTADSNGNPLGQELWESDGTESGTKMLADIWVGSESSAPAYLTYNDATKTLYFAASNTGNVRSLWAYDVLAGTAPSIVSGSTGNNPREIFPFGGGVIYSAEDATNGRELWGGYKGVGSSLIINLATVGGNAAANANPRGFVLKDTAHFYFSAHDGQHRYLYLSDGGALGTQKVSTMAIQPEYLTMMGNTLFFTANTGAESILFRSDGTAPGTVRVDATAQAPEAVDPIMLKVFHNVLYFFGDDKEAGKRYNALWSYTDGDTHETHIKRFEGNHQLSSDPHLIPGQDSKLYFAIKDHAHGQELWSSDATTAGTQIVHDVNRQTNSSRANPLEKSLRIGDHLYHLAYSSQADGNIALFKTQLSDGTTTLIRGDSNLSVKAIAKAGDDLYGLEYDQSTTHIRLWVLHSGDVSPQILKDDTGAQPVLNGLVGVGDSLYTLVEVGPLKTLSRYRLSDGAFNDIHSSNSISDVTAVEGKVFFSARGTGIGIELWRYDPANGTKQSYNIHPGAASSYPGDLTPLGSWLYFVAEDGAGNPGGDLWRIQSDGTGQAKLCDINYGLMGTPLGNISATDNAIYFAAEENGNGTTLWRYIPGGSVENLSTFTLPHDLTPMGKRLYFIWDAVPSNAIAWVTTNQSLNSGVAASKIVGTLEEKILYRRRTTVPDIDTLWIGDGTSNNEQKLLDAI